MPTLISCVCAVVRRAGTSIRTSAIKARTGSVARTNVFMPFSLRDQFWVEQRRAFRVEIDSSVVVSPQDRSGELRADFVFKTMLHGLGLARVRRYANDLARFQNLFNGH